MKRRIKISKTLIVIFLTALIWVLADLARTEKFTPQGGCITVSKSTDPNLWVSFSGEQVFSLGKIEFEGSASKVAAVERRLQEGSLKLQFPLSVERERGITGPGQYDLETERFLEQNSLVKQLVLTVRSVEPDEFRVDVVELVKKTVQVKCMDDNANELSSARIEPATVDMYVPSDWEGERKFAQVRLSDQEIDQARVNPIIRTAYAEFAPGHERPAPMAVKITMPAEDKKKEYSITATLAIALSPAMQGNYEVDITNLNVVMSPISISASPEAKQAYESQPYPPMTLYILDKDKTSTEELVRKVLYNFPEEFVRTGEIELLTTPVEARFRLIPSTAENPVMSP